MKNNFLEFFSKNINFFFIFTISFHFFSSFYGLENGGDAYIKIFFSNNFDYLKDEMEFLNSINASHHVSRWTIIIPLIIVSEFINNPFYLNFAYSFVIFISTYYFVFYKIEKKNNEKFLILVILILFPYQQRFFSQPLTEYLSFIFIFLSCLVLLNNKKFSIYISAILFFLSYGVKITNLYFLPGIFFYIFFRKSKSDSIKFIFILFLLFLIETVLFNILFSFDFGRLELLLFGNHLEVIKSSYYFNSYISTVRNKLFINSDDIKHFYYSTIFVIFFLLNFYYIYKYKYNKFSIIAFVNISYFFIYVFFSYKIDDKWFILEPSMLARHYYIYINLTLFLFIELIISFIFQKKDNYKNIINISLMIFIFLNFVNNFKTLDFDDFNKYSKETNKIFFNKYKDEIMISYLVDFYELDDNKFKDLKFKIQSMSESFKNCENKAKMRPCVLDLRLRKVTYN